MQASLSRTDDPLTRRVLAVCDAVGDFIEWWGFKAVHGRIWVLLALHRAPLSQSEIAELLGVSRSLISIAIGELTQLGLARATSTHRNAPYAARMDVWSTIADVLRRREWMLIEQARVVIEAAVDEAKLAAQRGEIAYDLGRMQILLRMTELAQALLRMLIALSATRVPEGFTSWLAKALRLTTSLRGL